MGVPILEGGPYVFNVNNLFTELTVIDVVKRMLLELKNALVALGGDEVIWHVIASCDASNVVNKLDADEEHDLWNTIADVSYGATHSWCLLENKTTGAHLLIDRNFNAWGYVDVKYSTGGTYGNNGTTSSAPTATDAGTMQLNTASIGINNSAYLSMVVNVMTSADHKTTRFYIYREASSSTYHAGWIGLIEEVMDTPDFWTSTNKTMKLYHGQDIYTESNYDDASPRIHEMDGNIWYIRMETDEPYAGWLPCYATVESYGDINGANAQPLNRVNVNLDLQGGYPACPIGLSRSSSGVHRGSMGRLRDFYWAPRQNYDLDTYPLDGSKEWVKWGQFMVPWNGTTPIKKA